MMTPNRRLIGRLLAPLLSIFLLCPALLGAEPIKTFDVPAGDAATTLRQAAQQGGIEIVFPVAKVRGVKTGAVRGDFTARQALDRMLAGTELFLVHDEKTGALSVDRIPPAEQPRERRPVDRASPPDAASVRRATEESPGAARLEDGTVRFEEVAVTGSRIRGLLGEATVQPVLSLTAAEIERTGATTLGEAFRYVPQISSYTEGQFQQSPFAFGDSSGDATSTRVTASLRGAPAGGTLLLVNGRRAPRNGQQSGQDSYDLSGIPLAAVERVEVLLDGASAVYGADAVGGVINIILKRNYRATELRLSYENTFDTDVNAKTASLTHGFAHGKLSGMINFTYQESGNLMWVDRDFLRTQDRREWGGSNNPAAQIPSANGTINVPAGNAAGVPAGTLLTIPSGANGTNMTPADYVAAGSPPAPPGTDLARWAAYNSPNQRQSVLTTLEYDLRPNLTAFAEFRGSDNRTNTAATPLAVSNLSIPANAPGNVFGVPVTMRRYLLDLAPHVRTSRSRNLSGVLGLRGTLPRDWRYEGSVAYTYTKPEFTDPVGFSVNATRFAEALANPNAALRPNFFYDALNGVNPNPPGLLESLGSPNRSLEIAEAWTYDVHADGPLFSLWSGEVRAALGAEFREEYVDFPYVDSSDQFSARAGNRDVSGLYAELRVPLIGENQNIPFVRSIEATAAVRRDGYEEFAGATTPRFGVAYRPFKWLLARASYGEGYKIPTLSQLTAPVRTSNTFFNVNNLPLDPERGNTPITMSVMPTIFGGNPNLVPEETESTTAGIVLEMPHRWFKGLSLSYDYYDHKYLNRISPSLAFADRLAIFPELFTRGPNLPGDPAGWAGPIISYDNRPVNVATNRISGWDLGLKYLRPTPWGEFLFAGNVSRAYRNENRPRPGAPPATNAVPESLPLKASGSLYWRKSGFETGVLFSYRDEFKRTLTERLTPSAIRWDWRASYDFAQSKWAQRSSPSRVGRFFADTRISLTIYNVFDEIPPMNSAGLPDSSIIDALGARYLISVTKTFGNRR